jgi:hypothetical protein
MPLIQVWKCPKSGNYFEDKTLYVTHLRALARQSINKKNYSKKEAPLKASWQELQRTARGVDDIKNWLMVNGRVLIRLSRQLSNVQLLVQPVSKSSSVIKSVNIQPGSIDFGTLAGPTVDVAIQINMPEKVAIEPLLRSLGGVSGRDMRATISGCKHSMRVSFIARDWAFMGAQMLYYHKTIDMHVPPAPAESRMAVMTAILERQFPSISWDTFEKSTPGVLAVADKKMFCEWLYQYAPGASHDTGQELPLDISMTL